MKETTPNRPRPQRGNDRRNPVRPSRSPAAAEYDEGRIRGRKYLAKIGTGTMKEVWVRGAVAEGSRVEWRELGEQHWRAGVCYDVAPGSPCPLKLTSGGSPPN